MLLVGVLGVMTLIAAYRFWPQAATPGAPRAGQRAGARTGGPSAVTAPDVHLHALQSERPKPAAAPQRDLFRFRAARAAAAVTPPVSAPAPAQPPASSGPPPPPAVAPITMRFIGLVEAPEHAQKIAILSDGRGLYHGREGDIIEGRYRILRIGAESVDMAYLDGRGRQTIRLSGS